MIELGPGHLVGLGGAVGAMLRFAVSELLPTDSYPYATVTVNVLGSFLLGLATFAGLGGEAGLLVGVGALGAFTTFSSFSFETVRLWETGKQRRAVSNVVGTFGAASLAVGLAWLLTRGL